MIAGSIIGLVMGALPGLTVTMTVVLVVSLTFGWEMIDALAFIIGAYTGGVMGGSISAITLNIPGTAAAVATVFDGYPLKKKGEAVNALNVAMIVSLFGGIFGIICLVIFGTLMGEIALKFGPQEYFLISCWGLCLVSVLSKGNMVKGVIATSLGLLLAMVGMDPITGFMRFTLGSPMLSGGFNYIVAMIGLFGMKEVFVSLSSKQSFKVEGERFRIKDLLPKKHLLKKVLPCFTWCAPIGAIVGLLPGAGGDIASLVSYGVTKQLTKNPSRPFGEGAYEGVAAPEISNDASIGGDMATMLTLGVPGDSVTAVIMGSFYLHGLLPGPTFMMTEQHYFRIIVLFLFIGVFLAYIFGILGSNLMLRALGMPKWYLIPFISVLCIVGSYSLQNSIYDVFFMLMFGLAGYFLEKADFPVSPIVLALILGSMIETNFRKAFISTGDVVSLITSFFTRPIALILLLLIIGTMIAQYKLLTRVEKETANIEA